MSAKSPQSTKTAQARQSLFTGQAPTALVRPFIPQETFTQPSLIDLRPTLKGAEQKPEDKKPGAA